MTREEAKRVLEFDLNHKHNNESKEALRMAIKALEQDPCEDSISRQAVLDGLASIAKTKAKSDAQKSLIGRVMFFVEQLPPVNPTKTGHWIPIHELAGVDKEGNEMSAIVGYMCSECGERHQVKSYYCRYCGARMVEPRESEGGRC